MKGWVGLVGWPVADGLPSFCGHPSAAGRSQDRESSPARDRRSTTVPRHQLLAVKTVKLWHKTLLTRQECIRCKIVKAIEWTHRVQLHKKNADRSARLTVLLKAASELKSTVAGKLFHTFIILFEEKFVLALLLLRYDTRCYFNVRSKADIVSLIYRTEPTTKSVKRKN